MIVSRNIDPYGTDVNRKAMFYMYFLTWLNMFWQRINPHIRLVIWRGLRVKLQAVKQGCGSIINYIAKNRGVRHMRNHGNDDIRLNDFCELPPLQNKKTNKVYLNGGR